MSEWSQLLAFAAGERPSGLALATVVQTQGSSYRRAGARMLISASGRSVGAVSGGCLEEEITQRALRTLQDGRAQLCSFDTRVRQGCHGRMDVLIEALTPDPSLLQGLAAALQSRRRVCLRTRFGASPQGSTLAVQEGASTAPRLFEEVDAEGAPVLCEIIEPSTRLVLVGIGPDVVPLADLAGCLGWEVAIAAHPLDRPTLAPTHLFHTAEEALEALPPDSQTAVVLMSHQYTRDLEYLRAFLPRAFPYLGLLGPRKRREQLLGELLGLEFSPAPDQLAKLHSPAGLDLGGEAPAEIALSIIAEIQVVLHARTALPLSRKKGGIHEPVPVPASRLSPG